MKVSVSLDAKDVAFLDQLAAEGAFASRSAAVSAAISMLRHRDLSDEYVEAVREWYASGDAEAWERTDADGAGREQPWW